MQKEYELSGKPGNIYTIGILVGSVVMFLCQYVYLLVNIAVPSFLLRLAVYGASLYLLFWVQKLVSRTGKCRGRTHAVICGFILGFIAVYLNMAIFAFLVMSGTDDSEGLFVLKCVFICIHLIRVSCCLYSCYRFKILSIPTIL